MSFRRPTVKLNVKSIRPIYSNSATQEGVTQHWIHNVVEAHAPGNPEMKYTIVDEDHLISREGNQEVSIRPLTQQELDHLKSRPTTGSWYNPNLQVYKIQYPIDIEAYFGQCSWSKKLELWVTEGLNKDPRLVDCFKSIVIPLTGEATYIQPLNAHAIWMLNSGTGKSFFAYLLGGKPLTRAGAAGALGSYSQSQNGPILHRGWLNGRGFPVLVDEVNTLDKPLIIELLAYLETGKATRALKVSIEIEGTKTVVLISNPPEDDLVCSLSDFMKVVCTLDHPERVGKRFGYVLLGTDHKRVNGTPDSSVRDEVRQLIETVLHQCRREIQKMFENNMDWIRKQEADIEKEILGYAKSIPNKSVSDFVKGQSYGCIKKLKMAAIRYIILEQLDRVPSGTVDFSERNTVFQRLLDINRDSWKKLATLPTLTTNSDKKQYVRELKAKHPQMSLREIARLADVSHATVRNWLDGGELPTLHPL